MAEFPVKKWGEKLNLMDNAEIKDSQTNGRHGALSIQRREKKTKKKKRENNINGSKQ